MFEAKPGLFMLRFLDALWFKIYIYFTCQAFDWQDCSLQRVFNTIFKHPLKTAVWQSKACEINIYVLNQRASKQLKL